MNKRLSCILAVCGVALTAGSSVGQEPFIHEAPLGSATARLTVTFHADSEPMVACTPEQVDQISRHGVEKLTALLPVLNARVLSRQDPPGKVVDVLLDAACYDGGIMGMGGYGRGDEKIAMAYEEALLGGEWGPPVEDAAEAALEEPEDVAPN